MHETKLNMNRFTGSSTVYMLYTEGVELKTVMQIFKHLIRN
jgi:hypothetical protein